MLIIALFVIGCLLIVAVGGVFALVAVGTVTALVLATVLAIMIVVGAVCLIFHGAWRLADPGAAKDAWEGRSVQGAIRLPGETREQAEKRLRESQLAWARLRDKSAAG